MSLDNTESWNELYNAMLCAEAEDCRSCEGSHCRPEDLENAVFWVNTVGTFRLTVMPFGSSWETGRISDRNGWP